MSNLITYLVAAAFGVTLAGCGDDVTVINQPPCVPCDTCNNAVPGNGRLDAVCGMGDGLISPDGKYLAFEGGNSDYAYSERNFPITGLSVMEISTRRIVHFTHGFFLSWTWSLDSRKLYYVLSGMMPIHEVDIATGTDREFANIGRFYSVEMSPTGKYLFCYGQGMNDTARFGVVRWDLALDTAEFIGHWDELEYSFMVVDDTTVCGVATGVRNPKGKAGIYYLNVNTGKLTYVENETLRDRFNEGETIIFRISPDKTKVLFDGPGLPYVDDGFVLNGVWELTLTTGQVRRILDRHPYSVYHERRPIWSSNTTFTADWYCRKDSTTLLYEYNLSGQPVRQLTRRGLKFWEVQ